MNKFFYVLTLLVLFASCNQNDTPKPDESGLFIKFFGGAFDDNGFSVAASSDGGYYLAGSTYNLQQSDTNVLVVKIDKFGNKVWEKSYALGAYGEAATDVVLAADGNIVVAGYKQNKYGFADFMLLKIEEKNPDNFEEYIFGDSLVNERAYDIVQAPDQAFIVYGTSNDNIESGKKSDMFLLKTNLTDTVWHRKIGVISKDDNNGSLEIKSDGNLVWCGTVQRSDGTNMRLILADAFGNLIWDYGFAENDNTNQFGYDMEMLPDGGYLVAGSRNRSTAANSTRDVYLVRTDAQGNLSSSSTNQIVVPGDNSQEAFSVVASGNEFAVTGYTITNKGDRNIYVARIGSDGNVLASKSIGGAGDDEGRKILKTADGYVIIGTIEAGNNTMMGIYKLNNDLELF